MSFNGAVVFVPVSSYRLLSALTEFTKIASATAIGFAVMGFIGYFVRLLHIPVNNILIGAFCVFFCAFALPSVLFLPWSRVCHLVACGGVTACVCLTELLR